MGLLANLGSSHKLPGETILIMGSATRGQRLWQARTRDPARVCMRAWGQVAEGPGRWWGWGRIAGGAAARKVSRDASGSEFALLVMGKKDRDCCRSGTVHCFDRLQNRLT